METTLQRTDEQLMQEFISGQNGAIEELVHRYQLPILNFVYPYFRNRALAEDLTQDIFVKLIESKHLYHPDKPFKPWFYQVARNRIYDELRKKKRWSLVWFKPKDENDLSRVLGTAPDPHLSPGETLDRADTYRILLEQIRSLDDKSRDMVFLRYFQGLSVRETADVMTLPEGTVQSGTFRALEELHKKLLNHGMKLEDLV
jgi:RNA polymerase sigma factor (sigma-70 family)